MSIQDDVLKLYKSGAKRVVLADINTRPQIPLTVGVGKPSSSLSAGNSSAVVRKHVITVFSHLIITADGAFERPHGWPADGEYPAGTSIPSPLPPSLINDAGTLRLDVDVQYYEQKRVHLMVYEVSDFTHEDQMLIPFAAPYEGLGQYIGLDKTASVWSADLFLESSSETLSDAAQARLDQLLLII